MRAACQAKYYSPKTARSYTYWIRQYILFHNKQHPQELGKVQIEAFLNYLALKRQVAASTQSAALNAIVFLYRQVLAMDVPELDKLHRVKRQPALDPMMFTPQNVKA